VKKLSIRDTISEFPVSISNAIDHILSKDEPSFVPARSLAISNFTA
jgi:hypothetical protein